jgi:hypothetical protein
VLNFERSNDCVPLKPQYVDVLDCLASCVAELLWKRVQKKIARTCAGENGDFYKSLARLVPKCGPSSVFLPRKSWVGAPGISASEIHHGDMERQAGGREKAECRMQIADCRVQNEE